MAVDWRVCKYSKAGQVPQLGHFRARARARGRATPSPCPRSEIHNTQYTVPGVTVHTLYYADTLWMIVYARYFLSVVGGSRLESM